MKLDRYGDFPPVIRERVGHVGRDDHSHAASEAFRTVAYCDVEHSTQTELSLLACVVMKWRHAATVDLAERD